MKINVFAPKLAAKALAGCFGLLLLDIILFGFPGICGMVGGVLPSLLPHAPDWLDYPVVAIYGATLLALPTLIVWLLVASVHRLLFHQQ